MPKIANQSVSVWQYCCAFCCWPVCFRRITNKLAFMPPEPTYDLTPDADLKRYELQLSESVDSSGMDDLHIQEVYYEFTGRESRMVLLHIEPVSSSGMFILYSHGNAEDLGTIHRRLVTLSANLNCDVLSYDYSGYGRSDGEPSEKNLYKNIEVAWGTFMAKYSLHPERVILYGYSLGSVPTTFLATKMKFAGVILQAPVASGLRMIFKKPISKCDTLDNLRRVSNIMSPVLVIHGMNDEVINRRHGKAIYKRCRYAVSPLWVEGAGHGNVEEYDDYYKRLTTFITEEIYNY